MEVRLFDFEKSMVTTNEKNETCVSDEEINQKYIKGEARIITEQGAIKLPLVNGVFTSDSYTLRPKYQRRITWDSKKRSKLIESFIMNVPVPPIFIYETEFGKYQVMDGLQRVSAIMDFYDNLYPLEELAEWKELNGRTYNQLPEKVKEGIDRRQITVVTLLKESAKDKFQEDSMKKMVFERLNTGGVKLVDQEIRNALYPGKFNDMCIALSENTDFRLLWDMPVDISRDKNSLEYDDIDDAENADEILKNKLYMRMYDVELVLRFFSMRHIDSFNIMLSKFLDSCLINGNNLSEDNIMQLKLVFNKAIENAKLLFGEKAFCQYSLNRGKMKWSKPQKMIYDSIMLALPTYDLSQISLDIEKNIDLLEKKYEENADLFNGKKQSKTDVKERATFFKNIIDDIVSW